MSDTIFVRDANALELTVSQYITEGYVVENKSGTGATLSKKKKFSWGWAILGFLFCIIGLAVYAIIYGVQKDKFVNVRVKQ